MMQKFFRHIQHTFVVMKGWNQVLNACAMGVAVLVAQLTDGFSTADLDTVHLAMDDHFLLDLLFADFVVPDLHFHASVKQPPLLGGIVGHRLAVAKPFVGDGFGGKSQRALAEFGDGARPFTRQYDVIPVQLYQVTPERQGIGMTDKVEPHIGAIAHTVEHIAKKLKVVLGNFRFTQAEMDGRNQVVELDGFYILFNHFAHLRAIPLILFEYGLVMDPRC